MSWAHNTCFTHAHPLHTHCPLAPLTFIYLCTSNVYLYKHILPHELCTLHLWLTYTHTHAHAQAHAHAHAQNHTHTHTQTHTQHTHLSHTHAYTHTYTCTHAQTHIHAHEDTQMRTLYILTAPSRSSHSHAYAERWGAGVETQKNVRGEIGGWGRVPFNETYAPSLSTIYDGA